MVVQEIEIQGMTCQHCVRAVREALTAVDGVRVERVGIGSAIVEYDPVRTPPAALIGAVNGQGYAASIAGSGSAGK